MNTILEAQCAQNLERHRLIFVVFIFLLGLGAGRQALEYYFPQQDFLWMYLLHKALFISLIICVLFLVHSVTRVFSARSTQGRCNGLVDSFVERSNLLALAASWAFTLFMAMGLSEWTESEVMLFGAHEAAGLFESKYYFQVLICCMALSYSLTFFFMYFSDKSDDEGEAL